MRVVDQAAAGLDADQIHDEEVERGRRGEREDVGEGDAAVALRAVRRCGEGDGRGAAAARGAVELRHGRAGVQQDGLEGRAGGVG